MAKVANHFRKKCILPSTGRHLRPGPPGGRKDNARERSKILRCTSIFRPASLLAGVKFDSTARSSVPPLPIAPSLVSSSFFVFGRSRSKVFLYLSIKFLPPSSLPLLFLRLSLLRCLIHRRSKGVESCRRKIGRRAGQERGHDLQKGRT